MSSLAKPIVLTAFVLIAVIILGICLNHMLDKSADELRRSLDRTEALIVSGNWSEAGKEAEAIKQKWKKLQSKWTVAVEHEEVDEISLMIFRLVEYIRCEEKASSLAELASLRDFILSVPDKDSFKLKNIL